MSNSREKNKLAITAGLLLFADASARQYSNEPYFERTMCVILSM